ncbi:MAG: hypothetical protein Q9190_002387 [Brigantiaea leucoxantha]
MDPLSIPGLIGSLIPIAYKIAAGIFAFTTQFEDNSDTLNGFAAEIASLSRILQAASSTLNTAGFPLRPNGPRNTTETDICRALFGAAEDMRLYLERIRQLIKRIQGESNNGVLYRRAIRDFMMLVNDSNIANLRSQLQTHQISLNTALVMVQLYHQTRLSHDGRTDLRPEIYRLTRLVERLPTREDLVGLEHDLPPNHIYQVQQLAQDVVRKASDAAGSSAASEKGAQLDPITRNQIDQWISFTITQKHATSNALSYDSVQETSFASYGSSVHAPSSWPSWVSSLRAEPTDSGADVDHRQSSHSSAPSAIVTVPESESIPGTVRPHSLNGGSQVSNHSSHPNRSRELIVPSGLNVSTSLLSLEDHHSTSTETRVLVALYLLLAAFGVSNIGVGAAILKSHGAYPDHEDRAAIAYVVSTGVLTVTYVLVQASRRYWSSKLGLGTLEREALVFGTQGAIEIILMYVWTAADLQF